MGTYRTALVCLNGHMVTSMLENSPEIASAHCSECGAKTISRCPKCNQHIRGYYDVEGVISISETEVRKFCHTCGQPYRWTESKLAAAKEYADELDALSAEEKAILKKSLDDLVRDTPQANVAGLRFKKIMAKVGKEGASAIRDIIVDVLSETAKKAVGL
jgi:hypothetical protein